MNSIKPKFGTAENLTTSPMGTGKFKGVMPEFGRVADLTYRYAAAETFWDDFYSLSPSQKKSARQAWQIFKLDPFDPRLRTHKIHRLSAVFKKTIYAVKIEGDLRSLFHIAGDIVWSVRIGTHDVYKA